MLRKVVKPAAFVAGLRKVKLLELLENRVELFRERNLQDVDLLHFLIDLRFLFVRFFLRSGFRLIYILCDWPRLLLEHSEIYLNAD